jgi:hypothetical protein
MPLGRADDSLLIHGMGMLEQDSAGKWERLMNDIGSLKLLTNGQNSFLGQRLLE